MYKLMIFSVLGSIPATHTASTDITATPVSGYSNNNILVSIDGFDDTANVEIETVPALHGNGSYLVSNRHNEKEISFEINIPSNFENTYKAIRNACLRFERVNLSVNLVNDNGVIQATETLSGGLMKTVKKGEAKINQNWGNIQIVCVFPNPTLL